MPLNTEFDPKLVSKLQVVEDSGISKATRDSKKRAETHFTNFLTENGVKLEDLIQDAKILEDHLLKYFTTYR